MKFCITSGKAKAMMNYGTFSEAVKAFYDTREIDPLCTLWAKEDENLYIYKPADEAFVPFP